MIHPHENTVQLDPVAGRVYQAFPNAKARTLDYGGQAYETDWFMDCPSGQKNHQMRIALDSENQLKVYCRGRVSVYSSKADDFVEKRCPEIGGVQEQLGRASLAEHLYLASLRKVWREFVIPDLIAPQDRLILTGEEGHGKTTLSRQIALQVACGIHPLTLEKMPPRKVLYLDREVGPDYTFAEFGRMVKQSGVDLPDAEWLDIWSSTETLDVNDSTQAQELIERARDAELLVIGPLYKLSNDDLAEDHVAKAVTNVLDQIRAGDTAMIIEAHQTHAGMKGRPKRPYGSSTFLRWPEFGLHLGKDGKVTHWRGSRLPDREFPESLIRGDEWPWMVGADNRKPWERLGMSKATYYRKLAAEVDETE